MKKMTNTRFWTPYVPKDVVVHPHQMYKLWEPSNNRAAWVGRGTIIGAFCDIGKEVRIGDWCLIQSSCLISNGVKIGDECFLGPGVNILNDKYMDGRIDPPVIGDRVHVSGGTIINPGVTIGDDVGILASGALITKDVPADTVIKPRGTLRVCARARVPSQYGWWEEVKGRVVW